MRAGTRTELVDQFVLLVEGALVVVLLQELPLLLLLGLEAFGIELGDLGI